MRSVALRLSGRLTEATTQSEHAYALLLARRSAPGIAVEANSLGLIWLARGRVMTALRLCRESAALLRDADPVGMLAFALAGVGQAAAQAGRAEAARDAVVELERTPLGHEAWAPELDLARAWSAAAGGSLAKARALAGAAAEDARSRGQDAYAVVALHAQCRLGDPGAAAPALRALAADVDGPYAAAAAGHAEALAAGDAEALLAAAERFAELDALLVAVEAADAAAAALRRSGAPGQRARRRRAGRAVAGALRGRPPTDAARHARGRRPDAARARDRAARRGGVEQPRDRRPSRALRAHGRQPPAERVPQARRDQPDRAVGSADGSAGMSRAPDVAVVGAGIVGAACALFLTRSGARVELLEQAFPGAGSSGAGEGNILAWDKELERELPLALRSAALWRELAGELEPDIEYERKGSIVVTESEAELRAATSARPSSARSAWPARRCPPPSCATRSRSVPPTCPAASSTPTTPRSSRGWPRPRSCAAQWRRARALRAGVAVEGIERDGSGRAVALATSAGRVPAGAVVVAAGAWTGTLLERCGLPVPIRPRKGQIIVLERSVAPVRRKLNEAGYLSAVESAQERLQVAMVVESTRSGTTLIGSSRELRGFDRTVDVAVAAAMARRAVRFFPDLRELSVIRTYAGLRPFAPDHLPLIGPLPEAENVCVASGHEGAGIGLAPATGELVAAWHAGARPPALAGFSPARFAEVAGA